MMFNFVRPAPVTLLLPRPIKLQVMQVVFFWFLLEDSLSTKKILRRKNMWFNDYNYVLSGNNWGNRETPFCFLFFCKKKMLEAHQFQISKESFNHSNSGRFQAAIQCSFLHEYTHSDVLEYLDGKKTISSKGFRQAQQIAEELSCLNCICCYIEQRIAPHLSSPIENLL